MVYREVGMDLIRQDPIPVVKQEDQKKDDERDTGELDAGPNL